jgi:hypothetical protein
MINKNKGRIVTVIAIALGLAVLISAGFVSTTASAYSTFNTRVSFTIIYHDYHNGNNYYGSGWLAKACNPETCTSLERAGSNGYISGFSAAAGSHVTVYFYNPSGYYCAFDNFAHWPGVSEHVTIHIHNSNSHCN